MRRTTPKSGRRRELVILGPSPPPVHGVTISTKLALENPHLNAEFDVFHIDTSDNRPISTMERWDPTNVRIGLANLAQLVSRLVRRRNGIVYMAMSENLPAFLRDALFIHVTALARWKCTVHIRNSTFREFYGGQNRLARWWIQLTLGRITSMAVLGRTLLPIFEGLVERERIAVVPNGTPDIERSTAPRDPDRVLYLSNLLRRKGIVESVEAAIRIVEEHPTAHVVFVGGWEDAELERELVARARVAGDRIEFHPPMYDEEKERMLASCAVLLFPPLWGEGHPRIVLEAICRGIPLVTTDRATIAETVVDGESAFILPDPDPEMLADRVLRLLNEPELRETMSRAARARYEAEYTQERAAEKLADWIIGLG